MADGRVTLTFHFWSGEQVTYVTTRSGTSVLGSPSVRSTVAAVRVGSVTVG